MTTEERILDSAATLFSHKGYKNTSVREIAKMAGVNNLTVFRHFHDKEALFREAVQTMKQSEFDAQGLNERLTYYDIEEDVIMIGTAYLNEIYDRLPLIRIYIGDGLNLDDLKEECWFIAPDLKEHFRFYIETLDQAVPLAKEHAELLAEMFVSFITKKVMPSSKDKKLWEKTPNQMERMAAFMRPQLKYMARMIAGI